MRVVPIMMPSVSWRVSAENTVEEAMKIIDEQGLLSLPVVDGQQFVVFCPNSFCLRNFSGTIQDQRRICTAKSDGVHEDKN